MSVSNIFMKYALAVCLLVGSFSLLQAQMVIEGTVTDPDGFPATSALVRAGSAETETDFNGYYELELSAADAADGNVNLSIEGIDGSVSNDVIPYQEGGRITRDFSLGGIQLADVVAIGYGTVKKEDLTGSVDLLTEDDFNEGNMVTAENLIQGRAAGVTVNTSGSPGSGSTIRIRGGSSVNLSNDPLIVIDGLPITNSNVEGANSILSTINPNDIESFSVLKDASATAIYGSRASNGVIIITTKRGKKGFKAEYNSNYSISTLVDKIDVFSGDQFRSLVVDQMAAGNIANPNLMSLLGNANTDWQEELFRNSFSTNQNLSLMGGLFDGALPTRLSYGYSSQIGTLRTSNFERNTVSLAMNPKFFDNHLKVNVNANYSVENNRFADAGQIASAIRYNPTVPIYQENYFGNLFQYTTINQDGNEIRPSQAPSNPLASLLNRFDRSKINRYFGNVELDYKLHFLPELRIVLFGGFDESSSDGSNITLPGSYDGIVAGSAYTDNNNRSFNNGHRLNKQFTPRLVYTRDSDNFDLELTAGYDWQEFRFSKFETNNLNNPGSAEPEPTRWINQRLISFFGRANMTFYDKYLLTLNYRRDGSSQFIEENAWGNFYGGAIAWQLHKEDFLMDSDLISTLKLRASYGLTGNQNIGQRLTNVYQTITSGSNDVSNYIFGNAPISTLLPQISNITLEWETSKSMEFGLDYGFLNDRITGYVAYYQKTQEGLLFNAAVNDLNFSNEIIQNIGELDINGVEFAINADIVKNDNFNWNINFNAAYLDREITKMPYGTDIVDGGGIGANASTILREGEAPFSFFSFRQLYDTNGNAIEGAFLDINGDGVVNSDDRYIAGDPIPDVTMGLMNTFKYKNWDMMFTLRANIGNDVFNQIQAANAYYRLIDANGFPANIPTSVLNNNFIASTEQTVNSDANIEDGSFVRMDNINLGYKFDNFMNTSSTVRMSLGVQNVFLISDYSGLDPEVPGADGRITGIDNSFYPRPRTFILGLNVSF